MKPPIAFTARHLNAIGTSLLLMVLCPHRCCFPRDQGHSCAPTLLPSLPKAWLPGLYWTPATQSSCSNIEPKMSYQTRPVFALPGRNPQPFSSTSRNILRRGAITSQQMQSSSFSPYSDAMRVCGNLPKTGPLSVVLIRCVATSIPPWMTSD